MGKHRAGKAAAELTPQEVANSGRLMEAAWANGARSFSVQVGRVRYVAYAPHGAYTPNRDVAAEQVAAPRGQTAAAKKRRLSPSELARLKRRAEERAVKAAAAMQVAPVSPSPWPTGTSQGTAQPAAPAADAAPPAEPEPLPAAAQDAGSGKRATRPSPSASTTTSPSSAVKKGKPYATVVAESDEKRAQRSLFP